jgi:hypothetical protein
MKMFTSDTPVRRFLTELAQIIETEPNSARAESLVRREVERVFVEQLEFYKEQANKVAESLARTLRNGGADAFFAIRDRMIGTWSYQDGWASKTSSSRQEISYSFNRDLTYDHTSLSRFTFYVSGVYGTSSGSSEPDKSEYRGVYLPEPVDVDHIDFDSSPSTESASSLSQ